MGDINRIMNNLCKMPLFNAVITKDEVDSLLQNHSLLIYCEGNSRCIVIEKITDNSYRISTTGV